MGVLTADHRIPDTEPFVQTVGKAMDCAEQNEGLVTIGIKPTRPDTGYGYIEVDCGTGCLPSGDSMQKAVRFIEKPDPEAASEYLSSGRFFWNSGMFFWRLSSFQNEFGKANPVMAETLEDLTDALSENSEERAARIFDALPNISIDYALMEKARCVYVVPGNFAWDDLGTWTSIERTFPKDGDSNVAVGSPVLLDTSDSIVYNAPGASRMAVGLLGMKDVVVIVNDDAVLVMPKDRAQDVKKVVLALRDRNFTQL